MMLLLSSFLILITPLLCVDVFRSGYEGYECYRIPSLLLTKNNILIAFTEGRKYDCGDHGYVDIVYKRSLDFGQTWSNLTILYSNSTSKTVYNTIGNPAPVQHKESDKIWMIFCKNNKEIYATYSIDDGKTFKLPPISLDSINDPLWHWVATGPPGGLEIKLINNKSRLIIPFDWSKNTNDPREYYTKGRILYTDNNGETWQISKEWYGTDEYYPNESQAVQLKNGSIFINSRTCVNNSFYRLKTISNDGGNTFVSTSYIYELRDTTGGCEGSTIMASNGNLYYSGQTPNLDTAIRANLTLHFSSDQGNSWKFMDIVEKGTTAYSSLVEIESKNMIAILYGRDNHKYVSVKTYTI
eukprot:140188_1